MKQKLAHKLVVLGRILAILATLSVGAVSISTVYPAFAEQDEETLRLAEQSRTGDAFLSKKVNRLLIIGGLVLLFLIIGDITASTQSAADLKRMAAFRKKAAEGLFFKFHFNLVSEPDVKDHFGYLRYLDLKQATFITKDPLNRGQQIAVLMKTLPAYPEEGTDRLLYHVRSCRPLNKNGEWYTVKVRLLEQTERQTRPLSKYLETLIGSRPGKPLKI